MKILSWNVNGYRAVLKKGFGEFLLSAKPDILGLQEVKACPDQLTPKDTDFAGYANSWNCAQKKGYSGVAAFYSKKPLSVSTGLGEPRFDGEGRVLLPAKETTQALPAAPETDTQPDEKGGAG